MNSPLINQSKKVTVVENVQEAVSFRDRLVGLMGRESFGPNQTLWFDDCNSIQTCFMRFPIDVVFVDRNFVVRKIVRNLKPWRLVLPVLGASAAFEFAAGVASPEKVSEGDLLHVGN